MKRPDPRLNQKSLPVATINAEVKNLISGLSHLLESEKDPRGIGLAAPQVGILKRIILVRRIKNRGEEGEIVALINPVIIRFSKKLATDMEGCLSVPGFYGLVRRPASIKITALNGEGKTLNFGAGGLFARVIQHEIDHLDGILFTEKVSGKLFTAKELEKD